MRRILLYWLAIAISAQNGTAKRFMKMFTDAGIGIHCPSGNKVYIHPISGDLQLCKQQLGVYNETSCPGGTACERFPIIIPGFQDYCCWSENNPETESSLELSPMTMSKLKPSVTVEPIDEERNANGNSKIFPIDEEEEGEEEGEEDLKIEVKKVEKKRKKSEEKEEEEEEDTEWEFETTTVKPKRAKIRKVPVATTTEPPILITTTVKTSSSRRPQCNDPEKTVLIDYGNRLRDCYFQQCLRGFKCEFNREIRRFICCGNEIDVPPAGLPHIPEPTPVLKRRPFRPNPRPFVRLNEGEEDGEKSGSKVESIESTAVPSTNRKGKYDEDEDYEDGDGDGDGYENGCRGNGCTFERGRGGQNSGCGLNCRGNGNNQGNGGGGGCGIGGCRRGGTGGNRGGGGGGGNSAECGNGGCPWNGNNNNNWENTRPKRPPPDDYEDNNENGCVAELGGNQEHKGPLPPIPDPRPLCKRLQFKKTGKSRGGPPPRNGGGRSESGKENGRSNSGSSSSRRSGPPPNENEDGNSWSGNNRNNNRGSNRKGSGSGNGSGSRRNNNGNKNSGSWNRGQGSGGYGGYGGVGEMNGYGNPNVNDTDNTPLLSSNYNSDHDHDRKVPRSVSFLPFRFNSNTDCARGAEYLDGFRAPKCLPPAIDSCPMSHKKCLYSQHFGHHVCCQVR